VDSTDPEIRRLVLDGMREALPDAKTEARVLGGLLARLSDLPPNDGGSDGGAGAGAAALAKASAVGSTLKAIAGAAIVTTAIVGGVAIASREPVRSTAPTVPAVDESTAREPAPSEPAPASMPSVAPTPPIASPPTLPVAAPPPKRAATPPIAPAPAPAPAKEDLAAETELLARAEAALATGDAATALALAADHARNHPKGQLALERDAIAAAAACVGGHTDARAAALRFVERHPDSAAAAKVRTRCELAAEEREGR
jgi:hypothetical protein